MVTHHRPRTGSGAASNGAYYFTMPLPNLGGPMGLYFSLIHRTDFEHVGPVVPEDFPWKFWWSPKYMAHLSNLYGQDICTFELANGDSVAFEQEGGEWVLADATDFECEDNASAVRYVLKDTTDYLYFMDSSVQQVYIFEKITILGGVEMGRLRCILDRNGNQLTYTYEYLDYNNPIRIEDGLGRSLDFTYQSVPQDHLATVTDQAGRQITFGYEYAPDNAGFWALRSVTDAMSHTTTFTYTTLLWPLEVAQNLVPNS